MRSTEHFERRFFRLHGRFDLAPVVEQEFQIALEEGRLAPFADGAADEAHAFRQLKRSEDFAEPVAFLPAFDAGREPDVLAVWHEHEVAARDRHVRRDPRPFGADGGFDDLHEQLHAGLEKFRDVGHGQLFFAAQRFGDRLAAGLALLPFLAPGGDGGVAGAVSGGLFRGILLVDLLLEQLVSAGEHFVVVEECVLFRADIDEGGLERGFEVDDSAEIDVPDLGAGVVTFDLILFQPAAVQHRKTAFELFAVQNHLLACFFHCFLPSL